MSCLNRLSSIFHKNTILILLYGGTLQDNLFFYQKKLTTIYTASKGFGITLLTVKAFSFYLHFSI
jgi:hypothetical protein